MFRLCLDNGLPAKPYKFVDHFDDYEETDDYKEDYDTEGKKIVLISFHEVEGGNEYLKGAHYINDQLWIDLKKTYLVCDKLSLKTKNFIEKNKYIMLGFFYHDSGKVKITEKIKID